MNESIDRIIVLLSSHRALCFLCGGTRTMVDWPAAPGTDPSRWEWLERCPSTAATLFFFGIWQIWSMDRQEPVTTLRGSFIVSLDWHRRVEAGTARWWIAGFVHFSLSDLLVNFITISTQWLFLEWRSVGLGPASGRNSNERVNSPDIQVGSGQWPFHPTANCSHLTIRRRKFWCGAPRWSLSPKMWINRDSSSNRMFYPEVAADLSIGKQKWKWNLVD